MRSYGTSARIVIHRAVLESIYDECDRHDHAETGGRLIGTYRTDSRDRLVVTVSGVIEPGPNASRTPTSLFQDGEYQARVFRRLESQLPTIEHLGSWHSHHVNGYPRLSQGDRDTYRRTVNHRKHNTDFFYALLVTRKNRSRLSGERYKVKHFIFYRSDSLEYKIPNSSISVVDEPAIWPRCAEPLRPPQPPTRARPADSLARESGFFKEAFPDLRPFQSKVSDTVYWRGRLALVDGSTAEVCVAEIDGSGIYLAEAVSVPGNTVPGRWRSSKRAGSLGVAAILLERQLNQEAFRRETRGEMTAPRESRGTGMSGMSILTLYVGQGALAVVRNGGEAIIVDSYLPGVDDRLRRRVKEMLDRILRGHRTAGLVLTGFDADHSSPDGVDLILSRYEPGWIMYPKYYKDTDTASKVFRIIESHERRRSSTLNPLRRVSVRVDTVESRELEGLSTRFRLELFSPHFEDMDNSNNSSIVLRVTGLGVNTFSYLITGDTEKDRWERINEIFGGNLRSQVLAAPHHGSKNAVHIGALLNIEPNTVLISAGVDNQYGHPDPQAVRVYRQVAEHVYSTNVEGGVSLYTTRGTSGLETQLAQ